jgi:hypothetical protein
MAEIPALHAQELVRRLPERDLLHMAFSAGFFRFESALASAGVVKVLRREDPTLLPGSTFRPSKEPALVA